MTAVKKQNKQQEIIAFKHKKQHNITTINIAIGFYVCKSIFRNVYKNRCHFFIWMIILSFFTSSYQHIRV